MRKDFRSAEAAEWRKLYDLAIWRGPRGLKKAQRAKQPLCEWCLRKGDVVPMDIVDHIVPHKGDLALFSDPDNLQSLCKPHHDAAKQGKENRGYSFEAGEDGWPVDPNHPANRRK